MPNLDRTLQGTVTGMWGSASIRDVNGNIRPVQLGDLVQRGDTILTAQDGIVQLTADDAELMFRVASPQDVSVAATSGARAAATTGESEIDRIIRGLDDPDSPDAPAAGLSAGDGAGEMTPGLRIERIVETVATLALGRPVIADGVRLDAPANAVPRETGPPSEDDSSVVSATEDGQAVAMNLATPIGTSSNAAVTVTQIPLIGQLQMVDGTPVIAGSALNVAGLSGLRYLPPADYDGIAPVGQFSYRATDGGITAIGNVSFNLATVNDPPVAGVDRASADEDAPLAGNVLANDGDIDGDALRVTQFVIGGATYAAGSAASIAGVGTLILNIDGSYVFTPTTDYAGAVPIATYTLGDGSVTTTSTLALRVTPVNDAPDARPEVAATPINVPVTVTVLANDSDRDADTLSVTSAVVAEPARGSVRVNADGTLTFTPIGNVTGPVTLHYIVSDGHGGSSGATVTIDVAGNTPPQGTNFGRTWAEDTSYAVTLADFGYVDADAGQAFANVRIDTLPAAGTLLLGGAPVAAGALIAVADVAAGRLFFVPAANSSGAPYASIGFSVQDSGGAFDTVPNTLMLTVSAVNDAPVAAPDTSGGAEDTPLAGNVLANDSDVDADALTLTQFTIAGNTYVAGSTAVLAGVGSLTIGADGSYTFTPLPNYNGPVLLASYSVSDGSATTSATLLLVVTPVNDAPVAGADLASTPINASIVIDVLANDSDVEPGMLSVSNPLLADPGHGSVSVSPDGTLLFTPAANLTGQVVITYTITDGQGGSGSASVTVNVGNNTTPTGANSAVTLAEDTSYTLRASNLGFADADAGQMLANVRFDALPAAGTLLLGGLPVAAGQVIAMADLAAGNLVFVPAANGNGAPYASFGFSVQDSAGAFDATPNTLTLNVTPADDVPLASNDNVVGIEDQPLAGNVAGNDAPSSDGGNVYALAAGGTPANGSVVVNADGSFTYTPNADFNGPDTFAYSLTDIDGSVSTAMVTIVVAAANDAPVASNSTITVSEASSDTPLGLAAPSDVDGDALTITVSGLPAVGTLTLADGTAVANAQVMTAIQLAGLRFDTPTDLAADTTTQFSYSVFDGTTTVVAQATINVTASNDAPVAGDGFATTAENTVLAANVPTATDVDGSIAGYALLAGPGAGNGSLVFNADGSYVFTPGNDFDALAAGASRDVSFAYNASDNTGAASGSAIVTITVTGTNDAALLSSAVANLTETDAALSTGGTLAIADVDSAATFVLQTGMPGTYGSFSIDAAGAWSYTASTAHNEFVAGTMSTNAEYKK